MPQTLGLLAALVASAILLAPSTASADTSIVRYYLVGGAGSYTQTFWERGCLVGSMFLGATRAQGEWTVTYGFITHDQCADYVMLQDVMGTVTPTVAELDPQLDSLRIVAALPQLDGTVQDVELVFTATGPFLQDRGTVRDILPGAEGHTFVYHSGTGRLRQATTTWNGLTFSAILYTGLHSPVIEVRRG
ncbi:MAG TPA: hypothetical protein VF557_20395 [Jatrophihabitans sp.]|jgi:hypothetical protein|uniref:hypothetical protein n=1 Tax=Jatrophihabitans sp. TaxID=1932789 RepID=UPI002EE9F43C